MQLAEVDILGMTSSERRIVNCLWETKEKTHIRLVAQKANLSSDYARLLCRSLARSGHIKFENDLAHLLKKGRSRFDASTSLSINPDPVERIENNDPAADESMVVAANVTLPAAEQARYGARLTDEPAVVSSASDRGEEKDKPEEPRDETELKPESKAEEEEEKETAPEAEMKIATDTADGKEETRAENPEKVALKEESVKSSGGFGISLKKIVDWFTEKK